MTRPSAKGLPPIEIKGLRLASPNRTSGQGHWRYAYAAAKSARLQAYWATLAAVPAAWRLWLLEGEGLHVTITRIAPGSLDDDNLAGSCKGLRDGIADAFMVDDRDPRVTWSYLQERSGRGVYGARVDVRPRTKTEEKTALNRAAGTTRRTAACRR